MSFEFLFTFCVESEAVILKKDSRTFKGLEKNVQRVGLAKIKKLFAGFVFFDLVFTGLFFLFLNIFIDPVLLFFNKAAYFRDWREIRGGNDDFRFAADLQRDGLFSFFASFYFVSYVHETRIAFS